jgi:predicted sulfurtransferase
MVTLAAYQFTHISDPYQLKEQIKMQSRALQLKGTVLIASEGINCFVAGEPDAVSQFRIYLEKDLKFLKLCLKENPCFFNPFKRLLVKVKKEIISMGDPSINPEISTAPRISANELKLWLDENRDFALVDTRNIYEVEVGTFEKALHLNIDTFREFPEASKRLPPELKDKNLVLFCTGGIRCEKASALLLKKGFKNVFQLDGGILKYFEECHSAHYRGNCFVFDWRLAVDPNLSPQFRSPDDPINAGRHKLVNNS